MDVETSLESMKTVILTTLVMAILALGPSPVEAKAETRRLELDYLITVAGVETGRLALHIERAGEDYRMSSKVRSSGLIDSLIGFRSEAVTRGLISARQVRPAQHRADNLWQGEPRFVRIAYGPKGPLEVSVNPLAEDDDRAAVAPGLRAATVDALSAAFAASLRAGAPEDGGKNRCRDTIAVFDGRRRYDILTRPVGPGDTEGPVYRGRALQCEIELHRIAGHSDSPWLPRSDQETGRIWFAELSGDWPPIPVRFEIDILMGSVAIHLQGAKTTGLDLKPAAKKIPAAPPGGQSGGATDK